MFILLVAATLHTYIVLYLITMDNYVPVWLFISIFLSLVSTLELIKYFLGSTFSTFPTGSLVEGNTICSVSMCFYPTITSRNFTNSATCKDLVKKYASMRSVLQYAIDILLLSTRSFTKKERISMFLEVPVHYFLPFFSILIAIWLSCNIMYFLVSYPCV